MTATCRSRNTWRTTARNWLTCYLLDTWSLLCDWMWKINRSIGGFDGRWYFTCEESHTLRDRTKQHFPDFILRSAYKVVKFRKSEFFTYVDLFTKYFYDILIKTSSLLKLTRKIHPKYPSVYISHFLWTCPCNEYFILRFLNVIIFFFIISNRTGFRSQYVNKFPTKP